MKLLAFHFHLKSFWHLLDLLLSIIKLCYSSTRAWPLNNAISSFTLSCLLYPILKGRVSLAGDETVVGDQMMDVR